MYCPLMAVGMIIVPCQKVALTSRLMLPAVSLTGKGKREGRPSEAVAEGPTEPRQAEHLDLSGETWKEVALEGFSEIKRVGV